MRRERILKVLEDATPAIAKHWELCRQSGQEGYTPARSRQVDQALQTYFEAIASPETKIMDAMKTLFARLEKINVEADDGLLETVERDLLVPVIIAGAVAAGLNLTKYANGDPTEAFRTF